MKFYITTPIYYINDAPHLGHYYTTLAADVLARFYRSKGDDVFFATGTDENSQKTIQGAEKAGLAVPEYTDKMARNWRQTWDNLNISYSDFIRTTEDRHKKAVEKFIKKVYEKGDIYKGKYEGLYCVGCENFKSEDELVNGLCPDHKIKPELRVEENYFFALSKYQDKLLAHFENNSDFAAPEAQRNEMISFIRQGLKDVSISRVNMGWLASNALGSNAGWGIKLPFDQSQTIWVWFDALVNYLSVLGYGDDEKNFKKYWPADLHLVGRDIFRFHSILWPAMLLSADLPLPKKVFAHGFFTINGQKMSKSLGNVISPQKLVEKYGLDATRYLLLSVFPFGQDGDFDEEKIKEKYNADLADGLGNLISRVFNLIEKNFDGRISLATASPVNLSSVSDLIENLKFYDTLIEIRNAVEWANRQIEQNKLWELAKNDAKKAEKIMSELAALIKLIAEKLAPFTPETSEKILKALAAEKIVKGEPLFLKIK